MRSAVGMRLVRVAVATAVLVSAAIGSSAASVAAASITFGTPTASSTFGKSIDFSQPYSANGSLNEVDIVMTFPGVFGPSVTRIDNPGSGSFVYQLDASTGNFEPNTKIVAHFEVTFADGTVSRGPDVQVTYVDDRFQWQTLTGKIVRLHWYNGDNAFAQQALQIGEQGIAKAASFLGYTETEPVDFYVYADQTPFYDALGPGTRDNVGGRADPATRTLFALIAPGDFSYAATVVPHELTHVVFDDITRNHYHSPPNWLNEGIAVYVAQGFDNSDKQLVSQASSNGTLMPLSAISGMFPTTQDGFYLAYAESVSAVDYFVRTYGHDDLVKLLKTFGTGASDDEAFTSAIGIDTAAFDKAWMKTNGVGALQSFGPQPAPTGPVPPGWTSSGTGGVSTASQAPGVSQAPGAASTASASQNSSFGSLTQGRGGGSGTVLILIVIGSAVAIGVMLLAVRFSRRSTTRGAP